MRYAASVCTVLVGAMSCDYAPLPRLNLAGDAPAGDAPAGVVSLAASPSVFVLHQNDTRDTTLSLTNGTGQTISVSSFMVSGLNGGNMTFSASTCAGQLAAGQSCSTTGHLVATATGQALFQVTMGAVSASLSMTAMPACPATCGPFGTTNCCASTVVAGNAIGATRAGDVFYRSHDNAADATYASTAFQATVSDFRLDTYLVTVGRFRAFVNAGMGTSGTAPAQGAGAHARIAGSGWDMTWNTSLTAGTPMLVAAVKCNSTYQTWTDTVGPNDSLPMSCITWFEAMAFCIWDGGYLPSDAEWNYAASGGSEQRPYPWSASDSSTTIDCTYANFFTNSPSGTYCVNGTTGAANRVGSESPKGDGKWGHADLAGNLFEWNLDWYNTPYPGSCDDCANLTPAPTRVVRGGDFGSFAAFLRAAFGGVGTPSNREYVIGVRCERTP